MTIYQALCLLSSLGLLLVGLVATLVVWLKYWPRIDGDLIDESGEW